jgi:hypothetical protein
MTKRSLWFDVRNYPLYNAIFFKRQALKKNYGLLPGSASQHAYLNNIFHNLELHTQRRSKHFPCFHIDHTSAHLKKKDCFYYYLAF